MYQFQKEEFNGGQSRKYVLKQQDERLTYLDFITFLQQDKSFRSFFINALVEVPCRAYQWETPPVTHATFDQPFEFVVHDRPSIDLPPDPGPFSPYFNDSDAPGNIAAFNNLGNDARLIAPAPVRQLNYSHIGVFTREAPKEQQHALWQKVGRETERLLSNQPLWLNTAGGGVAWLHVRLDSTPKYYSHTPYTRTK